MPWRGLTVASAIVDEHVSLFLDDLLAYVALGDDDREELRKLHAVLEPYFSVIAKQFYAVALAHSETAAVIAASGDVAHLERTLVDWMSTGLLGPYDDRFCEKRSRIGRRHVEIGLPLRYMVTAMNVVRSEYQRLVALLLPSEQGVRAAIVANKLLDVELAILLHDYQLDSERELVAREQRIQAERLAAIQTLAAGLAHEIRNPLNAAMLQLELLERRLRGDGVTDRALEPCALARAEIDRLADLLHDFIAFTRPPDLHIAEYDLAAIVSEVVDAERALASQRRAALAFDAVPVVAEVDALKVHQIVQNLVRNALEAVAPGGHVAVAVDACADLARIRIDDDGPGIPDAIRARVFEPFFSTKASGTGLGMSIVHSLVALHGGTVDLQSSSSGAHVVIELPRRRHTT